jgi:hypothetical protein
MRHARIGSWGLWAILAVWAAGSMGCTRYCYVYGGPSPCGPTMAPVVTNGSVCDVPAQTGAPVVAEGSSSATVVNSAPSASGKPPRVVVSEPSLRNRLRWKRSDPETGLATTKVDGAYDADSTQR